VRHSRIRLPPRAFDGEAWGADLLVEALRVEDDDDPTPVPSLRDRFRRWADAARHGGRLKATRLPGRDGSFVVFAAAESA